jgi:hypothetical protein
VSEAHERAVERLEREGAARIRWDDAAVFVIRLMEQGPAAMQGKCAALFRRVAVYDRASSAGEVAPRAGDGTALAAARPRT